MVLTHELENARWLYAESEKSLGNAMRQFAKSLEHLKHLKKLLKLGFVSSSAFQSYKQTTARYRRGLQADITQARIKRHEAWKVYDKLQAEYNKQNQKDTKLKDTLERLSAEQKQLLKDYFLQNN